MVYHLAARGILPATLRTARRHAVCVLGVLTLVALAGISSRALAQGNYRVMWPNPEMRGHAAGAMLGQEQGRFDLGRSPASVSLSQPPQAVLEDEVWISSGDPVGSPAPGARAYQSADRHPEANPDEAPDGKSFLQKVLSPPKLDLRLPNPLDAVKNLGKNLDGMLPRFGRSKHAEEHSWESMPSHIPPQNTLRQPHVDPHAHGASDARVRAYRSLQGSTSPLPGRGVRQPTDDEPPQEPHGFRLPLGSLFDGGLAVPKVPLPGLGGKKPDSAALVPDLVPEAARTSTMPGTVPAASSAVTGWSAVPREAMIPPAASPAPGPVADPYDHPSVSQPQPPAPTRENSLKGDLASANWEPKRVTGPERVGGGQQQALPAAQTTDSPAENPAAQFDAAKLFHTVARPEHSAARALFRSEGEVAEASPGAPVQGGMLGPTGQALSPHGWPLPERGFSAVPGMASRAALPR